MEIDGACLRWAKLENLERLASSLQLELPPDWLGDEERRRRLVRAILAALQAGAQPAMERHQ